MNGVQNLTQQKKYKLQCDTYKVLWLILPYYRYLWLHSELDRVRKVAVVEHNVVLFQHYPGGTEENYKASQLRRYSRNSYRSSLEQTKRMLLLEPIFSILKFICMP
jgi:hypothetical protein